MMKSISLLAAIAGITWWSLWFTPDQYGQRLLNRGEFRAAAETFRDPMRQGVAWFRASEFEKAEQAFARSATEVAEFNRGNCLVMLGKYEAAIDRYDRALELAPDFEDARVNRDVAVARAKLVERKGGDMGDQKVGADEITFDKSTNTSGQDTETEASRPLSDAELQAVWLRRIQTRPADFLKSKFAYQLSASHQAGDGR
jgi:Ca-activated chloride channel homolog